MYARQLLLFGVMVALLYHLDKSPDRRETLLRVIFLTLVYFLLHQLVLGTEEFIFQVTPWKKTCLQSHPNRCQGCCLPGFNGQPIQFHYTGDKKRMNMAAGGCACCREQQLTNRVNR